MNARAVTIFNTDCTAAPHISVTDQADIVSHLAIRPACSYNLWQKKELHAAGPPGSTPSTRHLAQKA